jgi:hypothetical protein
MLHPLFEIIRPVTGYADCLFEQPNARRAHPNNSGTSFPQQRIDAGF